MERKWLALALVGLAFIIIGGLIMGNGIKHKTTANGTIINDPTIWGEEHTIDGDVIPDTDNSHDLGSSSAEWKDLYIDGTANLDAAVINSLEAYGNAANRGVTLVWKTASEEALALAGQTSSTSWTDLDLTAYTSANAKMAYLELHILVNTGAITYLLQVRKNGTTPDNCPTLPVYSGISNANDVHRQYIIVGMDSAQTIEYQTTVGGGGNAAFAIRVLAYWE